MIRADVHDAAHALYERKASVKTRAEASHLSTQPRSLSFLFG